MSKSSSDSSKAVAKATNEEDNGLLGGIENMNGAGWAATALVYLVFPVVAIKLTQPGGFVQTAVGATWRLLIPNAAAVPKDRVIPALATVYATFAFGITGAFSVAGAAMARTKGLDNDHPRSHVHNLRGLPLRLKSAHDNLIEAFPMWALAATLAQVLAPKNQQIINLLGFAMLNKVAVHYPSYLLNVAPLRSSAHLFATSGATAALYLLATGAR